MKCNSCILGQTCSNCCIEIIELFTKLKNDLIINYFLENSHECIFCNERLKLSKTQWYFVCDKCNVDYYKKVKGICPADLIIFPKNNKYGFAIYDTNDKLLIYKSRYIQTLNSSANLMFAKINSGFVEI